MSIEKLNAVLKTEIDNKTLKGTDFRKSCMKASNNCSRLIESINTFNKLDVAKLSNRSQYGNTDIFELFHRNLYQDLELTISKLEEAKKSLVDNYKNYSREQWFEDISDNKVIDFYRSK